VALLGLPWSVFSDMHASASLFVSCNTKSRVTEDTGVEGCFFDLLSPHLLQQKRLLFPSFGDLEAFFFCSLETILDERYDSFFFPLQFFFSFCLYNVV
jgi:hypothetical protein